jgi:hypothetical protein
VATKEKDQVGGALRCVHHGVAPVHTRVLGRNTFAKLLGSIYPNVGPHKNSNHTVSGLFLLR